MAGETVDGADPTRPLDDVSDFSRLPAVAPPGSEDDLDLRTGMTALAALPVEQMDLRDLLVQVACFAVRVIPGADGAGLTLSEAGVADVIVKSAAFVEKIDAIQYGIGQGPCVSAAATGKAMRSGSLRADPRWPDFGPRAAALGVHSVLSLPLVTAGGPLGAMNVYAHAPGAFDAQAEMLGMAFAVPAAATVRHAQIVAQAFRVTTHLQSAAVGRSLIDQAVGILRSRDSSSAAEARSALTTRALARGESSLEAARAVVAETTGRYPVPGGEP